jgi:voltage-gated potassium channel
MKHISEDNNFVYLTISIIVLLFVGALDDQFPSRLGEEMVQVFTLITLAIGVIGFRSSKLGLRVGTGFIITATVVLVMGVATKLPEMTHLYLLVLFCFYLFVLWLAARQVLFTGKIDSNKIVGAICIYLLMGMIWSMMYLFIAQSLPEAFNGLKHAAWYENFADVTYFSFVTLTTLGYGDISPVAPIARFLVFMEALVGVFYMAILVASLIGVRTSK